MPIYNDIHDVVIGGAVPGGTDGSVLFVDGTVLGEDSGFTYNKTTNTLSAGIVDVVTSYKKGGSTILNTDTTNFGTFVGIGAGAVNEATGLSNVFVGYNAGLVNTTGDDNVAVGYQAMLANTEGLNNVAIGKNAFWLNTTGSQNIAIGELSLADNVSGASNVAVGVESLTNNTANFNVSVGYRSMFSNTTGTRNASVGLESMFFYQTGDRNVAFGYQALRGGSGSSGDNNIAIGYEAGFNITSGSNNIIIGYDIDAPSGTSSNQLSIGNLIFGTGVDGTGTTISSGNIGIGVVTPTAALHLKAGTTAASTAPLKLTSGSLNTTAEAGAIEFLTDDYYATITTGTARKAFVLDDGTRLTSGRIPVSTTNGRLTDDADFTWSTSDNELGLNGDILFTEISTPTTPAASKIKLYAKDDGSGTSALFMLDDAGTETQIGSGGGGGGGATTLPGLTDVDDSLAYTSGFVFQGDGSQYTGAVLSHTVLSNIGTNTHATIDTHIDSATTVHTAATNLIKTTGDQTITSGVKTFNVLPESSVVPTTANQLVNKAYADAFAQGLVIKEACRVATTTAQTLASDFENGDTIDGVVLATGDRILIKNQADATTNGIYTVNASGAPTRATDYDASSEVQEGTFTFISSGTVNNGRQYVQITVDPILGSSNLVFTQLNSAPSFTGGDGITVSGTTIDADIKANDGLEFDTGELTVAYDDSSIGITSNQLAVKALGVTNAMLAGSIADSKLSQITTASKVHGSSITGLASLPSGAGVIPTANLGSGTPDATTFLRGDQTYAVPAGSGAGIVALTYSKTLDTSVSTATISNSAVETTIYSYSVPANTLSTNKILKIVVVGTYRNFSGANRTVRVRMKYGATTVTDATSGNIATNTATGQFTYTFYLVATGATNTQQGYFEGLHTTGTGVQVVFQDNGTAAEDSTGALNLVITAQLSAATATQTYIKEFATTQQENGTDNVGAPTDASYVVLAANGNLSNERVLTGTPNYITLTDAGAGSTVTLDVGSKVYTVNGATQVALADGGTGSALTDPDADRILFWDDSGAAVTWLTVGEGLEISTTTLQGKDATTSTKGVASFNSTNFSVSSGAVNTIQNIASSASPTFVALNLTVNPGSDAIVLDSDHASGRTGSIRMVTLSAARDWSYPDKSGILQLQAPPTLASTSNTITFDSTYYGGYFFWSPTGTATATLPANGAAAGSWFEVYLLTDQTITISAATADTLITFNDTQADSVAFSTSGRKIGGAIKFVSNGTVWIAVNISGNTMTVGT